MGWQAHVAQRLTWASKQRNKEMNKTIGSKMIEVYISQSQKENSQLSKAVRH